LWAVRHHHRRRLASVRRRDDGLGVPLGVPEGRRLVRRRRPPDELLVGVRRLLGAHRRDDHRLDIRSHQPPALRRPEHRELPRHRLRPHARRHRACAEPRVHPQGRQHEALRDDAGAPARARRRVAAGRGADGGHGRMKLWTKVEKPVDRRVLVTYTKATEKVQAVIDCLRIQYVQPEVVKVDTGDAYWKMLRDAWEDGREFMVVEHDVMVWPGSVAFLFSCDMDWCVLPTLCHGRMYTTSLGAMRF